MSFTPKQNIVESFIKSTGLNLFSRLLKYFFTLFGLALMLPGLASAQTTLVSGTTVSITLTEGQAFSKNYIGSGTLNNSYAIVGSLPSGLSSSTGLPPGSTFNTMITFSGTPDTPGTYLFDVNVTPTSFSLSPPPYTTKFSIIVRPMAPVANSVTSSIQANSNANVINSSTTGSVTSLAISAAPSNGVASVNGFLLNYTPAVNFVGTDTFSYIAIGPGGSSAPASVTIAVLAIPPTTSNSTLQVNSGANAIPATIASTATSLGLSVAPTNGVLTISGLTLSYAPKLNFVGTDTFTYTAIGANGVFASSTVAINVVAAAPTTASATVQVNSGANSIPATIASTATSLGLSAAPTNGVLTISGLTLSYVPKLNFVGTDTFTYTAIGANGVFASSIVTIDVVAAAPTAASATVQVNSGANAIPATIASTATSLGLSVAPMNGVLTISGLTLSYVPRLNYVGTDTFTYTAIGANGVFASSIVAVNVVAAAPTAASATVQVNSGANAIPATIASTATSLGLSVAPTNGVLTISGLTLSYVPKLNYVGTDTFTYNAIGANGVFASSTVAVNIVAAATTVASTTIQVNSGANAIPATIAGTASSLGLRVAPTNGVLTISGLTLSYVPKLNYVGTDTFTYTAIGVNGVFASSTVTINIVAAAPTAGSVSLSLVSVPSASIDLATLVTGPLLTGLTVTIVSAPIHGVATLNGTVLTYTPTRGYVGADSLNYVATAIGGSSAAATISINVAGRPDPSKNSGVIAMQAATAATVRHFERAQLDNFNGRLTELSSNATRKTSANKQCGGVSMWAAGLSGLGTYKGPDGFEYNNSGTSIGGDRCFGSGSTVAGFGVGYGREHSKLNGDGSVMRATAATGATYGSLQLIPSLRFSWVAGVNQIDSNFDRYISINKTFGHGKWSGKQYLSSGSISHEIKFDQLFFVPFFKLDLSKLTLDPYAETGGGAYGLSYQAQTMSSQRATLGFNGEYTLNTSFGELTPRMRIEYQRDSARRNPLKVSYADGADDLTYVIPADELDRRALLASMGAELVLKNGAIFILNYAYSSSNGGNKSGALQLRVSYKF